MKVVHILKILAQAAQSKQDPRPLLINLGNNNAKILAEAITATTGQAEAIEKYLEKQEFENCGLEIEHLAIISRGEKEDNLLMAYAEVIAQLETQNTIVELLQQLLNTKDSNMDSIVSQLKNSTSGKAIQQLMPELARAIEEDGRSLSKAIAQAKTHRQIVAKLNLYKESTEKTKAKVKIKYLQTLSSLNKKAIRKNIAIVGTLIGTLFLFWHNKKPNHK